MDRIERLERWWLFYKAKLILKKAAFFGAAIVIGGAGVYFLLSGDKERTIARAQPSEATQQPIAQETAPIAPAQSAQPIAEAQPIAPSQPAQPQAAQPIAAQPIVQTPPQEPIATAQTDSQNSTKPKMNIEPSFDFEEDLNRRAEIAAAAALEEARAAEREAAFAPPAQTQPIAQNPTNPQSAAQPEKPAQSAVAPAAKSDPNTRILVHKVWSVEELEDAFNKQPSYSKAVDIAEEHLRKGDAQQAYKWALRANDINMNDDQSWAIFAVANYRMGNREKAINAIRAYLSSHRSDKLTKLLGEIERNEPNAGGDL